MLMFLAGITMALLTQQPEKPALDEFIGVAEDNWHFAGVDSGRPFLPFGANYVLSSKADLNLFGDRYEGERHERILSACAGLNITLLKVFLPIAQVLPDPQPDQEARIAPGWLDNLEDFLTRCRRHGIRAEISLTPWGGNGCKWWHEGGQYWGRYPWKKEEGPDSNAVLCSFWKQVVDRFGGNPVIFSWTPCVEWTLPMSNLTWFPPHGHSPVIDSEPGRWYWRRWLEEKYGSIDKLNTAWGETLEDFSGIKLPDYSYYHEKHSYKDSEEIIYDYQNFKEWTTIRYFRPQIETIRKAGARQMVTISCHMRFWDLWEGAAEHFLGLTPFEVKPMVDYITFHANYHENQRRKKQTDADVTHAIEAIARFVASGKPMPIILEEFTYTSRDPQRTAEMQSAMVRAGIGHVSGWTTWYLQYPVDPAEGADNPDKGVSSYWLDSDLNPSPWGIAAEKLYDELVKADRARKKAGTVIKLDRRECLVPRKANACTLDVRNELALPGPVDYELTPLPETSLCIPREKNRE